MFALKCEKPATEAVHVSYWVLFIDTLSSREKEADGNQQDGGADEEGDAGAEFGPFGVVPGVFQVSGGRLALALPAGLDGGDAAAGHPRTQDAGQRRQGDVGPFRHPVRILNGGRNYQR